MVTTSVHTDTIKLQTVVVFHVCRVGYDDSLDPTA